MKQNEAPKTIHLKDYTPPSYLVNTIDLDFDIRDGYTTVTSTIAFKRNGDHKNPLVLDGEALELLDIQLDGQAVNDYTVDDHSLSLSLPAPANDTFTLKTTVKIKPEENTALEGLYKSGDSWCTQCEAQGFRRITYYLDRPDVMTTYRVRVAADKAKVPVLLSNGNMTDSGDCEEAGRHFTVWEDPYPKPCYLFALVAGKLNYIQDSFTTMNGRVVDLRIYVRPGDEDQCHHAMESLKKSMKWDEDVYGREYDLDVFNIVAVSDFNMGAMENKSLNVFNTQYVLAHPDLATDGDFLGVEGVIAHEYFHNWTGNRITCRDWFQLSLKEGLTVFRDQEFSADMNSRAVQRIDDVARLRQAQFPEDASPMAHPIRPESYIQIDNFYTATVYEKGAEVIHMMYTMMGPEKYRKSTDIYFERHDGQAVTCEDWVKCMEDGSGLDLTQFRLWYSQAGTPTVTAKSEYDATAKTFTLHLTQSIPPTPENANKKPMHMPIAVGLIGPDGSDMDLGNGETTSILQFREEQQSFTFNNIAKKPVPSILRNFSAPVKLVTDLTDDDLYFQMVHDSDGFNRWEAGQTIALRTLLTMMKDKTDVVPARFVDAMGQLLARANKGDKALTAKALTLPAESYIAQIVDVVDPAAIHDTRNAVMRAVCNAHGAVLKKIYDTNNTNGAFSITPDAMAERALKNTVLRYLAATGDAAALDLAKTQYDNATTMTDRVAALSILGDHDHPARDAAYADFYNRYKSHALVIDKWFGLQATSSRADTITDVRNLMKHPDFDIKNPNRMRSLLGMFCAGNPSRFHANDGSGYKLLTETVITLNALNPQIAARMLNPVRQWRRFTPDRQAMMKQALETIAAEKKLSPNVYEIVTKTLAG